MKLSHVVVVAAFAASLACRDNKPQEVAPPTPSAAPSAVPSAAVRAEDSAKPTAIELPAWPGWPLPPGTKMTAAIFCEGTLGADLFVHDTKCSAAEIASLHNFDAALERAFTKGCIDRLEDGIVKGRVKLDEKKAAACIDAHVGATMRHDEESPIEQKVCDQAIDGSVKADGPCAQPWECEAGLTCIGFTKIGEGKCGAPPAIGAACGHPDMEVDIITLDLGDHPSCAKGSRCANNQCEAKKKAGDACKEESECADGLGCRAAKCAKPDKLKVGAACASERECGPHLYCADAPHDFPPAKLGTCTEEKKAGTPCASHEECRGRCRRDHDAGAPDAGRQCVSFCGSG